MADEQGQNQQNNQSQGGNNAAGADGGGGAPQRPDYVPEKFWKADPGAVDVEGLARGFTDISQRFAKGKEALIPEIKAELDKERFKDRPEKPEGYALAAPKDGPLAKRLAEKGLILLDQKPGADFKVEDGKVAFVIDQANPLIGLWRNAAHAAGLSQEKFYEGLVTFAEVEAAKSAASARQLTESLKANRAKLGDNADKRIEHLKGVLGADAATALDIDYLPASAIEALETLVEKGGSPKFSPDNLTTQVTAENRADMEAEVAKLQKTADYYQNTATQARVAELFKRLYPGELPPEKRGQKIA